MLENLIPYFNNIEIDTNFKDFDYRFFSINKNTSEINVEQLKNSDIVILSVPEYRASENFSEKYSNNIRTEFYKLFKSSGNEKIYDLGDLKLGNTLSDTYFALQEVVFLLLTNKIIPIIIGGGQDLTYSQFLAHEKNQENINIVSIDSCLDIGNSEEDFNSKSYIGKIIFNRKKGLFNYTNIGFQNYLVPRFEKQLVDKLNFDAVRLGFAKLNIYENEPILRDADIVSIDVSAIKHADAPGNINSSPNGFLPEEICQLARYAGNNDKITSFGIYEYNANLDIHNSTAKLLAQIIWHFVEAFYERKNEYPIENINNYKKFIVQFDNNNAELIFYKSDKTQRWWVETKNFDKNRFIISCSYNDYLNCVKGDISERIFKFYQKI